MKGKKILALLMTAALCVSMFTGCGNSETKNNNSNVTEKESEAESEAVENSEKDPVEVNESEIMKTITDGYYSYAFTVEGYGQKEYFFHFYKEQPLLGNVFYAGFASNQITFSGTYTVDEVECEYACFAGRDFGEIQTGTAPYTVTFYDWDGNVMDSCAFDGEILYNDMTTITGVGGGETFYNHDTDGENSPLYEVYQAEAGQEVWSFVAMDSEVSTITIFHNGRYLDMVNMMIEGTWSAEESNGGILFNLTPDFESDAPATLQMTGNKVSATYTSEGTETKMINTASGASDAVMTMSGTTSNEEAGEDAEVKGELYDDGTCSLTVSVYGQDLEIDTGVYSMGDDGYTVTFQFNNAGELVSYLGENGAFLDYAQAGTQVGDITTTLSITRVE